MEIKLKILTPIWTGGVETGKMDRLHETGIIGSLRWWYEIIVRGLGGDVCDPTSDNPADRCQFDTKAYEKTKNIEDGLAGVCPVCRLFGCTGWKRRFELQVLTASLKPFWLATKDKSKKPNHRWLSKIYDINSNLALDELTLRFRWVDGDKSQHEIMKALLLLVSQLGAIGSKPQYGFGIVHNELSFSVKDSLFILRRKIIDPKPTKNLSSTYPSLGNYWLLQCTVQKQNVDQVFPSCSVGVVGDKATCKKYWSRLLPVSFDIRYKLPGSIPGSNDKGLRKSYCSQHGEVAARKIFGTLKGGEEGKRASTVFVSHLYKEETEADYQLRVWGFTDPELAGEIEASLKNIFPQLTLKRKVIGKELLAEKEVKT